MYLDDQNSEGPLEDVNVDIIFVFNISDSDFHDIGNYVLVVKLETKDGFSSKNSSPHVSSQ